MESFNRISIHEKTFYRKISYVPNVSWVLSNRGKKMASYNLLINVNYPFKLLRSIPSNRVYIYTTYVMCLLRIEPSPKTSKIQLL